MSEPSSTPTTTVEPAATSWGAVVALGLGAFVIVAAEFLPVGILPIIARDTDVSIGAASALVLIPGLVAGLSAPLVITAVGDIDRRTVVLACTALLVVSNLTTWAAPTFAVLLVARVFVGLALGGFWAVGPSLGVRFATALDARTATSAVLAGISAGTVLGLPLGQVVSESIGWRSVFLGAAVAGLVVGVVQLLWIRRPAGGAQRIEPRRLFDVVRGRATRKVLIIAALAITGQLAASTYISVLLERTLGSDERGISTMLFAYGALGLAGNLVVSRFRVPYRSLFAAAAGLLAVVFLLIPVAASSAAATICLTAVWGLLWGAFPFLLQSWMMSGIPDAPEAGSAVLVTCFQLAIACGAAIAGVVIAVVGLDGLFRAAGALQVVACSIAFLPALRNVLRWRTRLNRP